MLRVSILLTILFMTPCLWAQSSPQSGELIFGSSIALSGPAADLGQNMKLGIEAAFAACNAQGGVNGRLLRLRALDDGYEPARTAPNMRELAADATVIGVVGNVGTPTAIAALPIVKRNRLPFIGAYTGADVLRKSPADAEVFNYRASYAEETAAMVEALVTNAGLQFEEIAFFTQRDGYGDAGYTGGIEAMKRMGLDAEWKVAHGRYERNSRAVAGALADILSREVKVKAVIMVGAYAPCAEFVGLAHSVGFRPQFLSVSFVGAESLSAALGKDGEGIIVTQVVPHPNSADSLAHDYRDALKKIAPQARPQCGSFEGYIVGRLLILALMKEGDCWSRPGLIRGFESLGEFALGDDLRLRLDRESHQACHRVWPTVLSRGQVEPFDWASLKSITDGQ